MLLLAHRLCSSPVVGNFLVIQVPHAGNERAMSLGSRPIDRFQLGSKRPESVVGVVFDNVVVNP
jgi:hypothetical protein